MPEVSNSQMFTENAGEWSREDEERVSVPRYRLRCCLGDAIIASAKKFR